MEQVVRSLPQAYQIIKEMELLNSENHLFGAKSFALKISWDRALAKSGLIVISFLCSSRAEA
jgi:hypothetical protein